MEDWKPLAGKMAQMGLPFLGRLLGGSMGGMVGDVAGNVIARALGVEATPAAVESAIENGETTQVVATLKAVEAEAAVRWPAEAEIEQHTRTAEIQIAQTNAQNTARIAEEISTNGFWLSLYRSIMMYTATGNLFFFGFLFFYALVLDAAMWARIVEGHIIIAWWVGAMGSILGAHFFTRATERKAAVQAPAQAAQAAATVASATARK